MKTSLFLGTALAAVLVTGMASAAKTSYIAEDMDGNKEKPTAVDSNVTAEARFTYDDVTKKLCGRITNTSGSQSLKDTVFNAAHIHKGDANTKGDNVINFDGFTGELKVNKTLTETEAAFLTGKDDAYVNLHTTANPDGEVRAQLIADGDDTKDDETCDGDDADSGAPASSSSSSSGSTSTTDGGKTSTSATPADTDGGGCNTTGSSGTGTGLGIAAGLGLALAVAARKRKKA